MNVHLTPEQERIVNDELKTGHFRSAEEVTSEALVALKAKESLSSGSDGNGHQEEAVREMLSFVEKNRTPLEGTSVKQLIYGHRV